ncbi:MAG TPA: hypothetical protein VHV58_01565 [Pseudolabrys sp.]|nr:hypothetical protein [Pseudolabrys sp.]
MRRQAIAKVHAAAFLCLFPIGAEATPLDDLIKPAAGNSACFTRVYDADHLRKNPQQKVTSMTVWLMYGMPSTPDTPISGVDFGLALTRRGDSVPAFAQGGCAWDEHANIDTSNRRMFPEFKKDGGVICTMLAQPDVFDVSSAEEGAPVLFDRGKDRDTLMLYLNGGLSVVRRAERAKHLYIEAGSADHVFQLHRAPNTACAALENAVTEPEPATKQPAPR